MDPDASVVLISISALFLFRLILFPPISSKDYFFVLFLSLCVCENFQ